jgi:hypothetical protein
MHQKKNLEVHHKRRDGGNGIDNALVLGPDCHSGTSSYGSPGKSPDPFTKETKMKALANSGHQCQCTSTGGCH